MQALSIQQPWAWLIANADRYPDPKRVENRSWRTHRRGEFLVHAGLKFDLQGYRSVIAQRPDLLHVMPPPDLFPRGGLVGRAVIVDCVAACDSMWFFGPHGFLLSEAAPVPFEPLTGKLGFFAVPASILTRVCGSDPAFPQPGVAAPRPATAANQTCRQPLPTFAPSSPLPLAKKRGHGNGETGKPGGPQ